MRAVILFFSLLISLNVPAQSIRVRNASQQDWSGGVAGKRGSNYEFALEFPGFRESITPDTLWIGNDPIVLITGPDGTYGRNCRIKRVGNTTWLTIKAGISKDDHVLPYQYVEQGAVKAKLPIEYKGVALLSYRHGNKKGYYAIPKMITVLEPLNYP